MRSLIKSLLIPVIFLSCLSVSAGKRPPLNFKKEFLARINKARAEGCHCGDVYMPPAPPLVWNDYLELAAQGHAEDMASRNYFSHTSKDGRSVSDRIIAAGYGYKNYKSFAVGENIAEGQTSMGEVMTGWLKSPGHCKNLMNPAFKEVGVSQFNLYWVQDFGGRVPFSSREQRLIKSGHYKVVQQSTSHD